MTIASAVSGVPSSPLDSSVRWRRMWRDPSADVLAGTAVTPADLDDPEGDVSTADEITMARNLLRHVPDPAGIGVASAAAST